MGAKVIDVKGRLKLTIKQPELEDGKTTYRAELFLKPQDVHKIQSVLLTSMLENVVVKNRELTK